MQRLYISLNIAVNYFLLISPLDRQDRDTPAGRLYNLT